MKESTVPHKVDPKAPATREESRTLVPAVDIFETDGGLAVVADLPGVAKENVDVNVENNVLTIQGKAQSALAGEAAHSEYALLNYFRQFELSDAVDQDGIRADMKYGVLTIRLPRVKAKQPKKIAVSLAA